MLTEGSDVGPYGHTLREPETYEARLLRLDSLHRSTGNLDYLSDKGVLLILLRRTDEAIALYQGIEAKSPGRYSTAANLGTAYELAGKDADALRWIRRAVEIDPTSHHGSEWIHVKILEAKTNPSRSIDSRSLIGTEFGMGTTPATSLSRGELETLSRSLAYQLNERMTFIHPKDPIVAQLLFDQGNLHLLLDRPEEARLDFGSAIEYGFTGRLVADRLREANRRLASGADPAPSNTSKWPMILGALAVLGSAGTVTLYRLRRREPEDLDEAFEESLREDDPTSTGPLDEGDHSVR